MLSYRHNTKPVHQPGYIELANESDPTIFNLSSGTEVQNIHIFRGAYSRQSVLMLVSKIKKKLSTNLHLRRQGRSNCLRVVADAMDNMVPAVNVMRG